MRSPHKALLPLLFLAACTSTDEAALPPERQIGAEAAEPSTRERARAALESGDFETARKLTGELLLESKLDAVRAALDAQDWSGAWPPLAAALQLDSRDARVRRLRSELARAILPTSLARARELILAGDPRDAMMILDEAVRVAPKHAEVQLLRGECALRMGIEDGNPLMFVDARNSFLIAARTNEANEAWLGAARAGWLSYYATQDSSELATALVHAKSGIKRLGEQRPFAKYLSFDLDKTYAEVAFAAYSASKSGALSSERTAALFEETRAALEAVIGLAPDDPWAWTQLANLYQWEGRLEDARDVLARGLTISPEDAALHESQERISQALGGWEEVVRVYGSFTTIHPELAIGYWHLGRATYEGALERLLNTKSDESAGFQEAEGAFRHARELDPSFQDASLGYEAICRDGIGWSYYNAGDLDRAAQAFRSMEELFPGAMRWEVQGKLWSGVASLEFLVGEHNKAWEERAPEYATRFPHLVKAAALADELFAYDPESSKLANNAGYFNREVATNYEQQALELLIDKNGDAERAKELLGKAVEHMERSYAAYQVAAKLAPNDARIVNDTGLILAYYLQRDLDVAQAYFESAIAVGLPQLEAGIADEEARTMTREAVGDAYQNLGVSELTLRGDAAAAKPWFEKSLDYERFPRTRVTQHFIPLCDKVIAGEISIDVVREAYYWKDLDPMAVLRRVASFNEVMGLTSSIR